jgi:hypothetical protein
VCAPDAESFIHPEWFVAFRPPVGNSSGRSQKSEAGSPAASNPPTIALTKLPLLTGADQNSLMRATSHNGKAEDFPYTANSIEEPYYITKPNIFARTSLSQSSSKIGMGGPNGSARRKCFFDKEFWRWFRPYFVDH